MRRMGLVEMALGALVVGLLATAYGLWRSGEQGPLRLGTNVWIGYEPLHAFAATGGLGPELDLVEYVSATQVLHAFRNGDIDAAALTLDETLRLLVTTDDLSLVSVTDVSRGGDGLVAEPRRQTLAELRGARVGVEGTALGAYVLMRALELGGLEAGAIRVVPLTINEHEAAFVAGKVDAVVTFEPVLTRLQQRGARLLLSSRQLPGEIVDVLVLRRSLAQGQPGLATMLRSRWLAARAWAVSEPDAFAHLAASRLSVRADEIGHQLEGITLPDAGESDRALHGELLPTARRLVAAMQRSGMAAPPEVALARLFEVPPP